MAQVAPCRAEAQLHENHCSTSHETEVKRKPPTNDKDFLEVLIQDVLDATGSRNEASNAFNAAIGQFPSGLPYPDGAQRIKNTSAQLSTARKHMMMAHDRLNDFLSRGI